MRKKVPAVNIWHMLRYAWQVGPRPDGCGLQEGEPWAAENLFAHILVSLLPRLLHNGLEMAYREREDELTTPRGRLLVGPSFQRGAVARQKIVCAHDHMTPDVLPNQVIKAALVKLLRFDGLDPALATRIRRLLTLFAKVQVPKRASSWTAKEAYRSCRTKSYRRILFLCLLLERKRFVGLQKDSVAFTDVGLSSRKLGILFQLFIKRFFVREMKAWPAGKRLRVVSGGLDWDVVDPALPALVADIRLVGAAQRLLLEVKLSQRPLASFHGRVTVPPSHLYQVYSYLHALSRLDVLPEDVAKPAWRGVLVYGRTVDQVPVVAGRLAEYAFSAHTIDLLCPWSQVEAQMRALLGELTAVSVERKVGGNNAR